MTIIAPVFEMRSRSLFVIYKMNLNIIKNFAIYIIIKLFVRMRSIFHLNLDLSLLMLFNTHFWKIRCEKWMEVVNGKYMHWRIARARHNHSLIDYSTYLNHNHFNHSSFHFLICRSVHSGRIFISYKSKMMIIFKVNFKLYSILFPRHFHSNLL